MKFRMLTKEEMEIFDEDFKHFMITNGVTNEEWLEWNNSDTDKAIQLVQVFSDTVLQKVYEKIQFIEFRSEDSCIVFQCLKDKIELISINKKGGNVNLATPESIHEALSKETAQLTYFKSEKKYSKTREEEIHEMITQGCFNSTQDFWDALKNGLT
ncbi:MAG: hypothetical protein HYR91_11400 [Flavobacteriia bacterium]|nr:hypothetical protein [Flavobacteriia bacterium]